MRSSTWHLTSRRSALVVGLVAVVAAVVVVGMVSPSGKASGKAAAVEFRREPVGKTSVPAFTRSVGQDRNDLESPSNGGRAFLGNTPGLYAGAPDRQSCDRGELIRGLQADPKKAATWSRIQHIGSTNAIADYVDRLTGAVLRSDTYAKVYGSRPGAKPSSAVLQAGTAVFVNQRGEPVVKCNCGSPVRMAAPPQDSRPTFTGPEWSGFSKSTVTEIQPASKAVKRVVMLAVGGKSELFKRPLGDGGSGGDSPSEDTVLAKADYPPYLAMPGEQGAPDLTEAPKPGEMPADTITPLETKRPSGSPSGGMPDAQTSDQPTDPNQQPTDPGQQSQPQPSDPNQQQPPPSQPDPNQSQPQPPPPPNQPPPNQPPPNQPPPQQPPPNQPPPQQPPGQNQQPQPDPNQTQPPPQPPPSGP
ncbi:DUF6777 domain-containing protein [Streptomyces coffeae]|uniref:Serine/arginine repetitive matrix protein 1 n=1 Tax=Streptomyces coffeae TaxID=621382 RepID=A0ABS1N8Z1_9ACTN|nr:DUF6777 domain-containing protein [Streptomyces coffeae]MBL1096389.1 serine/arginine repetitive matrix protein 1 [Streptomyces coffeae]